MKLFRIISIVCLIVVACQQQVDFQNNIHNDKDFNIFNYRNFYNGGGVAVGDINNDNLPDIYFASNMGQNSLYINKGNFVFEDITLKAGVGGQKAWSTGVVMVDINHDGYLDIYVCNAGNVKGDDQKNELFINNGDITFSEKAVAYNLDEDGFTTHAAFFDYDLDGDLDCYILNNSFLPVNGLRYDSRRELRSKDWDVPDFVKGGGDKLLKNENGKFVDVSDEAGIYGSLIGFGLGVNVADINQDMLPDIYVSNDFYERDYLYINQGDGSFVEEIKKWTSHISLSSMGADIADINNDGFFDIFVTDMLPEDDERLKTTTMFESYDTYQLKLHKDFYHQYMQNTLQLHNGNNAFVEIAPYSDISATDWSWGALMFDYDNDGYRDIYVCNGIYHDLTNQDFMDFFANDIIQKMIMEGEKKEIEEIINKMPSTPIPNYIFRNKGNLKFENYSKEWGMDEPSFSNGAAYGDLDNDGDLDLVVNNLNQKPFIFKNTIADNNHHLNIRLKGSKKNPFGIGSFVRLYKDDQIFSDQLIPSKGFQSSVDYKMVFGLGQINRLDSLIIIWPDKKMQTLYDVNINQTLELVYSNATQQYILQTQRTPSKTAFKEINNVFEKHIEDYYNDFNYEGLITHMSSREGPKIAVGDINNDKQEDLFICGAKGQDGQIYLQQSSGKFRKSNQPQLFADKDFEDTDAVFFDADTDGDLDLYVVSGGNEAHDDKSYLKDRLYRNNDSGKFVHDKNALPAILSNGSCVRPVDYDGDGDLDLFVGSRSVAGIFGISPKSYLLENNGKGKFKNVTHKNAIALLEAGMITDAAWVDINADSKPDLVVVGEFMAPEIFINDGQKLKRIETELKNLNGWWFSITPIDVNNDKKLDLVLGNMGENTNYKVSDQFPMKLYINDFDENGTIEQICTHSINGKDKPIHLKNELTSQLTKLKKKNLKFTEYAKKSIHDLFPPDNLKNAQLKLMNYQKSCVAVNKGDGQFEILELPQKVQLSSINAVIPIDINKDDNIDLLLTGNFYHFKPQFGRLDASYGDVLLGDGKGKFIVADNQKTGFFVRGESRDMKLLNTPQGKMLIVARNNQKPVTFIHDIDAFICAQ